MIALPPEVQLLLRQADEFRQRFLEGLEVGTDPIILAQDLHEAGDSMVIAAAELATHARKARRVKPSPTPAAAKEHAR